jgi:hypothetical protein
MPNVELHGFKPEEAEELRKRIVHTSGQDRQPWVSDIVFTIVHDDVTDMPGKKQPFIRLVCTLNSYLFRLIEYLREFGFKVEFQKLEAFYPKSEE